MKISLLILIVFLCLHGHALDPRIIDFESMPDGAIPAEGLSISNQFIATHGVSFVFENGAYPQIGEIGWPTNRTGQSRPFAFWGPPSSSNPDGLATNQNVGRFFITDGRAPNGLGVSGIPPALLVFFSEPTSDVSGEIIDIQNDDGWLIEARGQQTQILATVLIQGTTCPNCGDGQASPFSISTNGIWSLSISSTKTSGAAGWALDNFCPKQPYAPARLKAVKTQQNVELAIGGTFNRNYRIEYQTNLFDTWYSLAVVSLTNSPTQWLLDSDLANPPMRYYRAVALP